MAALRAAPFQLDMDLAERLQRRHKRQHYSATTAAADASDAAVGPNAPSLNIPHSAPAATTTPPRARSSRHRPTSYFNAFQTTCSVSNDAPPSYKVAVTTPYPRTLGPGVHQEQLPGYSQTVGVEGKFWYALESNNPCQPSLPERTFKEVYVELRGTLLKIHKLKDDGPGKLLRSYSLQHAEVGLASDAEFDVLIPQKRYARFLPGRAAQERAWHKDPDLFKRVAQVVLRLRVETDQLVLADEDEGKIFDMVNQLCAGIDLSPPIDARGEPNQRTVPRRTRRPRRTVLPGNLDDPQLLAEQERLIRENFPNLAGVVDTPPPESLSDLTRTVTGTTEPSAETQQAAAAREDEEIDLSELREESIPPRPPTSRENGPSPMIRQSTGLSVSSTLRSGMLYATAPSNFDLGGKWQPVSHRTPEQRQRFIRRCMPVLLVDADRASPIVFNYGQRMKINRRMEILEDWEQEPPSYKAHKFDNASGTATAATDHGLGRSNSQRSSDTIAPQRSVSFSLATNDDEQIVQVEGQGFQLDAELQHLAKVASAASTPKVEPSEATLLAMASVDPKGRSPEQLAREIHDIVFCF